MAGTDLFRTFKGLSELKLFDINDSLVYNLPVPLDLSIDNGIQERRIPTRNVYGEQVFSDAFPVARDPVLRIVFPTMTPEVLQLKTERQFSVHTGLEYGVAKTVDVSYMPRVTFDAEEHIEVDINKLIGLPSTDVTTVKSVLVSTTENNNSVSFTVTTTPTATALPATALTTKNAGLVISQTIATVVRGGILYLLASDFDATNDKSTYISLVINCASSVLSMGEKLTTNYKMFATLVTTENQLVVLTAPKVKPSFQGSNFSPSMEQIECIFYLQTPPGQCKAYDIIYTDTIVSC
jgi:hypothetical protein